MNEGVAPFQGHFQYLIYFPQKPDKWGCKVEMISDSQTGYCLRLIPRVVKSEESRDKLIISNLEELNLIDIDFFLL